ncbi:MAG: hypothetical protein ACLTMP_09060 [Eggerthella lenta]
MGARQSVEMRKNLLDANVAGSRAATERPRGRRQGYRCACAAAPQLAAWCPTIRICPPPPSSGERDPHGVDDEIRRDIMREVKRLPLNRYPDRWPTTCAT